MPRYFDLLSLYFATKMHAEQFKAIIANLPLHQLCKYLCEKAQEDGSEVYERCAFRMTFYEKDLSATTVARLSSFCMTQ